MRSYTLFQEYIWLVSIIHKARGITFGEINRQKPRFIILMLPPHALLSSTGAISYVFTPPLFAVQTSASKFIIYSQPI